MRYNEKEIAELARQRADIEGRLNYKSPPSGFRDSGYKDRWFKLKGNILFYFRINDVANVESQPTGAFILENCSVQIEHEADLPFCFSVTFNEEPDKKHLFSTTTQPQLDKWTAAVQQASYEYWRTRLSVLQQKLHVLTGKDPLADIPHNRRQVHKSSIVPKLPPPPRQRTVSQKSAPQKSTSFRSHISGSTSRIGDQNSSSSVRVNQNLIDL